MRLTPLDIRKQEFTKSFRGFDPEEVQAFLQMVASQWGEMQDEHRRFEEKLRALETKIQHYEKVEEALQEALQVARETTHRTIANAEARAKNIIREAEIEAESIKRDAQSDHERLKREASQLSGRRNEIAARLRAFLLSEMELLAHFEGEDPYGFIKLMPAEQSAFRGTGTNILPQSAQTPEPEQPAPSEPTLSENIETFTSAPLEMPEPDEEASPPPQEEAPPLEATLPLEPLTTHLTSVPTPAHDEEEPPAINEAREDDDEDDVVLTPPADALLDEDTEPQDSSEEPETQEESAHPSWVVNSVLTPDPAVPEDATPEPPPQEDEQPKQKLSKEMEMLQRFLNQLD